MDEKRKVRITEILNRLNIKNVNDFNLLDRALIHPSYLYDGHTGYFEHNQRLEFLGDAVVGLTIAHHLFVQYPHKSEGELTKIRASLVCEASLADAAREIKLGEYLLMGKGEEHMGGANRPSNLADCFEAFVGALYLTIGMEKTCNLVISIMKDKIIASIDGIFNDFKTQLQEHVQKKPDNHIAYKILKEEGPDHEKTFYAAVYLNDKEIAQGSGRTKKEAEQEAAKIALKDLGEI
ncbi:MAG: ribonuclease III [Firmicutes bacterium HGW-Firmicutes-12]|nr:MAG: ribonuclease III [Firmicutes bacterium HGW-Firmicutes-12]